MTLTENEKIVLKRHGVVSYPEDKSFDEILEMIREEDEDIEISNYVKPYYNGGELAKNIEEKAKEKPKEKPKKNKPKLYKVDMSKDDLQFLQGVGSFYKKYKKNGRLDNSCYFVTEGLYPEDIDYKYAAEIEKKFKDKLSCLEGLSTYVRYLHLKDKLDVNKICFSEMSFKSGEDFKILFNDISFDDLEDQGLKDIIIEKLKDLNFILKIGNENGLFSINKNLKIEKEFFQTNNSFDAELYEIKALSDRFSDDYICYYSLFEKINTKKVYLQTHLPIKVICKDKKRSEILKNIRDDLTLKIDGVVGRNVKIIQNLWIKIYIEEKAK